jgi:hypothetical protein
MATAGGRNSPGGGIQSFQLKKWASLAAAWRQVIPKSGLHPAAALHAKYLLSVGPIPSDALLATSGLSYVGTQYRGPVFGFS